MSNNRCVRRLAGFAPMPKKALSISITELYLNAEAAQKIGIQFTDPIKERASRIVAKSLSNGGGPIVYCLKDQWVNNSGG